MPPANTKDGFYALINRADDCWLWGGSVGNTGYGRYSFQGKRHSTHRLMWLLTYGEIPDGLYVCHHCDNKLCVNPSHLFLGTHLDNMKDKAIKGRNVLPGFKGEEVGTSKLKEWQVLAIRAEYKPYKNGCTALGQKYGIDRTVIHDIVTRKLWKHI